MLNKALKSWNEFWFAPRDLLNIACMRVVLAGTMLHLYFLRSWNLDYYTDNGMMPRSLALPSVEELYRPLWGWFFWPDSWVPWMHSGYVVLLLLLFLGIGGRVVALAAWALHMGFLYRNYGALFGADVIAGLMLFYVALTDSCARLSVLNLIRKNRPVRAQSDWLTSAVIRIIQFQICIIYTYTGFEKLKGSTWWDGTALWSVLVNPQMVNLDFSFLRHVPLVIAAGSFSAMLFEIYFAAAMLNPKLRRPWLIAGVLFHLSIGFLMGLMHFSLAMMSTYFLFIGAQPLEKVLKQVQKRVFRVSN
jgi:hypothetical protein